MSNNKYYNYPLKSILIKDLDLINNIKNLKNINLCLYKVNCDGLYPLLEYLLVLNENKLFTFPKLSIYSSLTKDNLVSYSKVYLSGILQEDNFEEFSKNILFDGFQEYKDSIYLFFDVTKYKLKIKEDHFSQNIIFGLMDEIINHKNICNINIDLNIYLFFIDNDYTLYLYDEVNKPYETPTIGFVGKNTDSETIFTMTFGETAKNKSAILGPYFYFTNFNKSKNKGIIRFALFLGKTKYIENAPNDDVDESEIKKQRLSDNNLDKKREILLLRISDHNGIWTKRFDSVYLVNLELDDGSQFNEGPLIVLKDSIQQLPLSYHFYK
jgi:hypothetical protein